ncbi:MAG: hypothetical protein HXS47_10080 [Theionarchaea archaeon]|nr:hypothetical protein [Theionarchaea archaeon]
MTEIHKLHEKEIDIGGIVQEALKNKVLLSELLDNLTAKDDTLRSNSFQIFMYLSEKYPETVYPYWDFFVDLLTHKNTYHKYIGIYIIAALAEHDVKQKFESLFDMYYSLLDDKSVIPPSHIAKNTGKIVKAYPHLQKDITRRLLSIDKTHHDPGRKALIKGYIIEAFDDYFEMTEDTHSIVVFVKNQLDSDSPRTRKVAEEFLRRWNHE